MILCPSCNARNANRSTFCIRCGAVLSNPADRDPGDHTDAFSVQPEHTPAGLIDTAAAQLAEGQTRPAIENCRRAIALSPGEVEAHAILAMAYEQQGELPAALEAYETVVALAPQRNAERQKAALLRLRMGSQIDEPRRQASRPVLSEAPLWQTRVKVCFERIKEIVATNPPLYAGIASGLVIFLLGTILLVHANRSQAARQIEAQYAQEIQLADQALVNEQYVEASAHYAAAWRLNQNDPTVLTRWNQAYEACSREQQAAQIAAIPKYIPNLTGRNPFEPVPIGGTGVALPPPTNPAVPPPTAPTAPTVASERPPMAYETVREQARQLPETKNTAPSSRRILPSPFGQPITPVQSKNTKPTATAVAAAPAAPPVDTTPKGPKGEITIWVSDKPAQRPQNAPAPVNNNADSLRSRGESAAAAGRTDEAINYLNQAASAYDDRARQDPSSAAISGRAAGSCRARINVLRQGQ